MRVVHSRIHIFRTRPLSSREILTWYLSVLSWQEQGHEVKFYCDAPNLKFIQRLHLDKLYNIIDSTFFDSLKHNYDLKTFWAMPKLLAYAREPDNVIISDTDLFPFSDLSRFWNNYDVVVYANKEFVNQHPYPPKERLSTAPGYEFPEWMDWTVQPLNTAITYFKSPEMKKEFLDTSFAYVKDNYGDKKNRMGVDMVFAEQRILAMVAAKNNLRVGIVQPLNKRCINKNALHLWAYKSLPEHLMAPFDLYLFELLHNIAPDFWETLRDVDELQVLFDYVDKEGFVYPTPAIFQLIFTPQGGQNG